MNKSSLFGSYNKIKNFLVLKSRIFDIKKHTYAFGENIQTDIKRIYVINLDRKPKRWRQVSKELQRIKGKGNKALFDMTRRFSAVDARYMTEIDPKILIPRYSLADQLSVDPHKQLEDIKTNEYEILMTPQENAIALSHISLWKSVASGNVEYTLILEDDIFFTYGFAKKMNQIWSEIFHENSKANSSFDILFLSFQEIGTATNKFNNKYLHKPHCGVWQASGYVLSKTGAEKLLKLLPAYGPIDLWLNLQFDKLNVLLANEPIIDQRVDVPSTNSYSIMPLLSKLGVYNYEKPLIPKTKKLIGPIFGFGGNNSGLTSLAIALSMVGYTCCSDLKTLPGKEKQKILSKTRGCFNAYINIGELEIEIENILKTNIHARVIFTSGDFANRFKRFSNRVLFLPKDHTDKWESLSKFLSIEYPAFKYPNSYDLGQQELNDWEEDIVVKKNAVFQKFDVTPWIISSNGLDGYSVQRFPNKYNETIPKILFRNDTFPSNLSLFSSKNIDEDNDELFIKFEKVKSSVRDFRSGAVVTEDKYLYGKFSAEIIPPDIPGLVTGLFLHRNSPYQEIDIEFLSKYPQKMLINVFYNPGYDGAKLEYGYRGTPVLIDLGFDATKDYHKYEIEWGKDYIYWIVDGSIVYYRKMWNPTPIPDQPMSFNINLWRSRSNELSGIMDESKLPAYAKVKAISIHK